MLARTPRLLLRAEGLAVFGAALALYVHNDFSILALVLLFFAPDLSFFGYVANPRAGSISYNAVHTEVLPIVLGTVSVLTASSVLTQVALIWLAHIGFDRLLGYGLKYPSAFEDTHLNRV